MPCVIAWRVVSFPATISRQKKLSKSRSESRSPSTSAWTSLVTRSSFGSARRCSARPWPYAMSSTAAGLRKGRSRYSLVSSLSITAREYSGSAWAIMASPSSTHIGRSSSGTPMIRARTRIGSSREICSTKSNSPLGRPRSSTSRACSRTNPSYRATALLVKSLLTRRRSREWLGGSMSIIEARASTSSSVCSSSVTPRADENVFVSRRTSSMSWNRVIAQKPRLGVGSGCQWTGSRSRSSRKAQSGTSSTKASWLDRSISSSRTLTRGSSRRRCPGSLRPNERERQP